MPVLRALLLFPLRPGGGARTLAGHPAAALVLAVPVAAFAAWLVAGGAAVADAAIAAGAFASALAALWLGGLAASLPASHVAGRQRSLRELCAPCAAMAAWAPPLFALFWLGFAAIPSGPPPPLGAGLVLLVWATASGMAVLDPGEPVEGGRGLVASCAGLSGAVMAFFLTAWIVQQTLLLVTAAPADLPPVRAGDRLLVLRRGRAGAGDLVLARGPRGAFLARIDADGTLRDAAGLRREGASVAGRVFFRVSGR